MPDGIVALEDVIARWVGDLNEVPKWVVLIECRGVEIVAGLSLYAAAVLLGPAAPVDLCDLPSRPVVIAPDVILGIVAGAVGPGDFAVIIVICVIEVHRRRCSGFVRFLAGWPTHGIVKENVSPSGGVGALHQFISLIVNELAGNVRVGGAGVLDGIGDQALAVIKGIIRRRVGSAISTDGACQKSKGDVGGNIGAHRDHSRSIDI